MPPSSVENYLHSKAALSDITMNNCDNCPKNRLPLSCLVWVRTNIFEKYQFYHHINDYYCCDIKQ